TDLGLASIDDPRQRPADLGEFAVEPPQPDGGGEATELRFGSLGEREHPPSMPPPDGVEYPRSRELLLCELAHRLQHGEARLTGRTVALQQQAVLQQRRQAVQCIDAQLALRVADR